MQSVHQQTEEKKNNKIGIATQRKFTFDMKNWTGECPEYGVESYMHIPLIRKKPFCVGQRWTIVERDWSKRKMKDVLSYLIWVPYCAFYTPSFIMFRIVVFSYLPSSLSSLMICAFSYFFFLFSVVVRLCFVCFVAIFIYAPKSNIVFECHSMISLIPSLRFFFYYVMSSFSFNAYIY